MIASTVSEVEEYMASLYEVNVERMGISKDDSDVSSDEVEIIQELKVTLDEHQCDLCCRGSFLVNKLLQFGGLEHKYACEMCLESFKTKPLAVKHARKHERESAISHTSQTIQSPVINTKTGISVIETTAISEASTSTKEINTKLSTLESELYFCYKCNLHFKSDKGLKRHNTNKHGLTHFCRACGTNFKNEKKFKQHCKNKKLCSGTVKSMDDALPKLLNCPSCQKNFLFKKSFEEHVCRIIA